MGQIINAGGLYSSVLPNCSCVYKFDGFNRANELNINLPGSNFYNYSKHTEINENGNETSVPDWKVIDNKLIAQIDNPWISFRSTIPLGMVFYYGGHNKDEFKLNLSYNEAKVGLYFEKGIGGYGLKMNGIYGMQNPFYVNDGIFSFSHYTQSESCFKSFAVCNNYYANGIEPSNSGILYLIEFEGATAGETYLTNLVLQRNTLECLNLNNENTRLFPNNLIHPTGYMSLGRGACYDSINTVFSWHSNVGYKDTEESSFLYRSGFRKNNNINNNYCKSCYELQKQIIEIGINKEAEINRLDDLILALDIEWISKQEELSEAEDAETIININQEIKNIEEKIDLLKTEKAFVQSSISEAEPEDLEKIIIPHNRGAYLPICNPCLSQSTPKITISFEAKIKQKPYFKGTGYNISFASSPSYPVYNNMELITPEDLDIGGTYELEQSISDGCNFTGVFEKAFSVKCRGYIGPDSASFPGCWYDADDENREYSLYIECSVTLAYIDFETGKIRHKIHVHVYSDYFSTSGNCFEFAGDEYIDSIDNICGKKITVKCSHTPYVETYCYTPVDSEPENLCCDSYSAGLAYQEATEPCRDCPLTTPLGPTDDRNIKKFVNYFDPYNGTSCYEYKVKQDGDIHYIGKEESQCRTIDVEIEIN